MIEVCSTIDPIGDGKNVLAVNSSAAGDGTVILSIGDEKIAVSSAELSTAIKNINDAYYCNDNKCTK